MMDASSSGSADAPQIKTRELPLELHESANGTTEVLATGSCDGPEIPIGACVFCAQKCIESAVVEALGLARQHFRMVGKPEFEVIHDPDHGEHYLGIHVWASGEPDNIVRQGRSFTRALRDSVDRDKLNFINVIYHAI